MTNMVGSKHFVAACVGVCLLPQWLIASVAIKPAFVEVKLDEGRPSGTFLISNVGETEERFRVTASHFVYTEDGVLKQSSTGDYSLAPFIHFNPRELTLAPKTQRAVRFAIVPRGRLAEGEWWAAMELESLIVNDFVTQQDTAGRTAKLKAVSRILVPIFGSVGKTSYAGQIKELDVDIEQQAVVLKGLVATTGTGRLRVEGDYEITDLAGKVVDSGPFALGYVLRDAQRWFTRKIDADIPKGQYKVKVSLQALHVERPLVGEATVTWPQIPATEPASRVGPEAPSPLAEGPSNQPNDSAKESKRTEVQGSADSP